MMKMLYNTLIFVFTAILVTACATSPTGRSQFLIISEEQAIDSSKAAYLETLKPYADEGKLDTNPELNQRVRRITGRLIAQAIRMRPETEQWDWSMKIIDDPKTVNAWAMAGGKMALYTGLIQQIKPTDDELAQVLAHEISHALAKHTAEKMSVAMASQMGVMAVGVASKSNAVLTGASLAAKLAVELPNSRTAETEADRIGIELAAKAGYDPRSAATLWQKMGALPGGRPPQFLSTHPSPENRQKTLERLAREMMPYYEAKGPRPSFAY